MKFDLQSNCHLTHWNDDCQLKIQMQCNKWKSQLNCQLMNWDDDYQLMI